MEFQNAEKINDFIIKKVVIIMDAKQATIAVRDYFESIKKIKFFFEVNNAKYDEEKKIWTIICKYKMFLMTHLIHIKWESMATQEILFM